VIPVSPNTDDIRDYIEMRLERDDAPEPMTFALRLDMVRVILEKVSDPCVGPLSTSTPSAVRTYRVPNSPTGQAGFPMVGPVWS